MKQWRHYFEAADHKILIQSDHQNLEYFQASKELFRRQARWGEVLSSYDFTIEHLDGSERPEDGPSRRPICEVENEKPVGSLLATLPATVQPYNDILPAMITVRATNSLPMDVNRRSVDIPIIG
jgi:hypothetical protein